MNHTEYQAWIAQIDRLTSLQRQQAMNALAQLHPLAMEPTFDTDENLTIAPENEPNFFTDEKAIAPEEESRLKPYQHKYNR